MKVVLASRYSDCCAIVPIRSEFSDEFLGIFHTSRVGALRQILDDVGIYRLGLKPKFISVDTANRLDSLFSPNTSFCTGILSDFYRIAYAYL